jgi:hypothetical protein
MGAIRPDGKVSITMSAGIDRMALLSTGVFGKSNGFIQSWVRKSAL